MQHLTLYLKEISLEKKYYNFIKLVYFMKEK